MRERERERERDSERERDRELEIEKRVAMNWDTNKQKRVNSIKTKIPNIKLYNSFFWFVSQFIAARFKDLFQRYIY